MATSASRCLFSVSSQVSLRAMTSKFYTWMNAISLSIFGDIDCTLAVRTFSRLLGGISLSVFVAGCFLCDGDRGICRVWSALCCCCPWQSLSFLQVAVVDTVGARPCWLLQFLLVVIGFVACGPLWILWIIIDLSVICHSKLVSSSSLNHFLLLCCPLSYFVLAVTMRECWENTRARVPILYSHTEWDFLFSLWCKRN